MRYALGHAETQVADINMPCCSVQVRTKRLMQSHDSPVGESYVIGQQHHLLGQLLSPVVPEGSTLHAPLSL